MGEYESLEAMCDRMSLTLEVQKAIEDIRKPWIAHAKFARGSICVSVYGPSEEAVKVGLTAALSVVEEDRIRSAAGEGDQ